MTRYFFLESATQKDEKAWSHVHGGRYNFYTTTPSPPFLAPTVTSQTNMKDVPTLKVFSNGKTERQRLGHKLLLKFHTLLYFYLWNYAMPFGTL